MARNLETKLNSYLPRALAVFRVIFGLLFLCHGLSKVMSWPVPNIDPVGEWPDFFAGWIELVTSPLIIAGLFTRFAAFVACGEMAVAYFTVKLPHGFIPMTNHGEAAVMYCFAFFLLIFAGGGAYTLDARWARGQWRGVSRTRWRENRQLLRR
jgi:putative oxidoreductase